MAYNSDFQQTVMLLLAKLKNKKEALQQEFEARSMEIDREIESVSTTLRLLREPVVTPVSQGSYIPNHPGPIIAAVMGKTMREALIAIANNNNGIVRIVDVKPILMTAGIIKKPKHAWGAIYTTLTRSGQFEKVQGETGTFRLVDDAAQRHLPVAS